MVNNTFIILIVGTVLGFLSGIGVGGGSLLILWLTLVLGVTHSTARVVNLLFFIPSALIASIFRWKQGQLKPIAILPAIVAGCISAGIFSTLSHQLDIALLKKLFGMLLLATGIRELLYKQKNEAQRPRNTK